MRAFVAVEISDDRLVESIRKLQSVINIDARPVDPENFHFTLQFLGEVSEDTSQRVIKALQSVEFSSFAVGLRGMGAFPRAESPRSVWIGADRHGGDLLVQLAGRVKGALEPLGFFPDKPFRPHLTVFRVKKKIGDITEELKRRETADFGVQEVTEFKIKKSELTPDGPVYSDLEGVAAQK